MSSYHQGNLTVTETWVSDQMELSVYGHVNQPLNLPISKLLVDFFVMGYFGGFFGGAFWFSFFVDLLGFVLLLFFCFVLFVAF